MTRSSARWWGLILTTTLVGAGCSSEEEVPEFALADPQFEQCVRDWLNVPAGELTEVDVAAIVHLECQDRQVVSLDGIEYFHGLRTLYLWENQIADLTPLAGVPTLESLELGHNQITDISPLAGLIGLSRLGLADNQIGDLAPLAGLTRLRWLGLDHNLLTDVQATQLCELPWLTWLTVEHNRIATPSLLACLDPCQVYADYQETGRSGDRPAELQRAPRLASPFPTAIDRGRLGHRVDEAGAVRFTYEAGGEVYPVIAEYAGTVRRVGDRLLLGRAGGEVEIGALVGDELELCAGAHATVCRAAVGHKGPWDGSRVAGGDAEDAPVFTLALDLYPGTESRRDTVEYGAVNDELLPYALSSPNQFDAGSCLFMATTGAAEILLNQHASPEAITYKGDTDLSERFLMNASDYVPGAEIRWVLTDLLYTYNHHGGSMLDRDYPFVADYVVDTPSGGVARAEAGDDGAYLSCYYNWFDDLPEGWESQLVATPPVERTVIFADPTRDSSSQWRVGLMDNDTVNLIKHELLTKRAPVVVVYNHYLYWHTDVIVGYDDDADSGGCPMVESSLTYFEEQGATSYITKIERHMAELGGCTDRGIFYVRDSIYDGTTEEPNYTYGQGFSDRYSKRIITRSYNWVRYLANHAYSVHRR